MERGVYFDAWFPRQHCYHPSLPPRRLRMIDDLRDLHATLLTWSALGGGSLSIPYLEQEAFGEIDPRFRFYGFVNDSEFIKECQKFGIKVFGIVFEVQGWEFPAELNEDESQVLALNELRGSGKPGWIGLREFSQNRYPKLWAPLEKYFPGGLFNSQGERVTDLIEECCSRDIDGNPCHARWVECPDREHQCYMMDRNNPVWREYLKAVIRTQIDAGVDGIQLDEAELPITSFQYGGCLCHECMRGFREYLIALPTDSLPSELNGIILDDFHYGNWLKERGYDFKTGREETPLFWEYLHFQHGAITRYFAELADYAREYARSQGRHILVSGNFFNLFDQYYPLEPKVDVIITEMRNTSYRQPAWYRYVAGFAGHKPVIVVENPYGGIVPDLVDQLQTGHGYDRFRISLYEAAALGANMSVPYGAWMGSVIQDSFHPPHDLCVEIQDFLADHEALFSSKTASEIGVIYSTESNTQLVARRDLFADNRDNQSGDVRIPFWDVCEQLSDAALPYDVIFFPDGELRPDPEEALPLSQYRTLIVPECRYLTTTQAVNLGRFLDGGGNLLVLGQLGLNLSEAERALLLDHPHTQVLENTALVEILPNGRQVQIEPLSDLAVNLQQIPEGVAMHIIRYAYDSVQDQVPTIPSLRIELRLPQEFSRVEVYAPDQKLQATLQVEGGIHCVGLVDVPLYSIVVLKEVAHAENLA